MKLRPTAPKGLITTSYYYPGSFQRHSFRMRGSERPVFHFETVLSVVNRASLSFRYIQLVLSLLQPSGYREKLRRKLHMYTA